ncbi:MAG TPA: hypothetical protein VHX38_18850 [Pseudonocardiaceae bacterium]|nr:hypothetical protein [Pseudonocardiaceae bacterium]
MTNPRVRIELKPMDNHVWINDVDIRNLVTAVRIEFEAKDGPFAKVSLDLMPGAEIMVDGELIEAIQPVLVRREVTP